MTTADINHMRVIVQLPEESLRGLTEIGVEAAERAARAVARSLLRRLQSRF